MCQLRPILAAIACPFLRGSHPCIYIGRVDEECETERLTAHAFIQPAMAYEFSMARPLYNVMCAAGRCSLWAICC